LSEKEDVITEWEKERETLKVQCKEQSFELQKLQLSLQPVQEDNVAMKRQLKEANDRVKTLSTQADTLSQEKTRLTKELQNVENLLNQKSGADKQIIERLNEKVSESEKQFETQKQTVFNLNKHMDTLKEEMAEQKIVCQKQATDFKSQIGSLETEKLKVCLLSRVYFHCRLVEF
ncbi:viral A-type inclusion protein, partial [Reticulomyxa filosa]